MKKILGLDLGVASIGWSLIEQSEDDGKILKSGVRIFQANNERAIAAPENLLNLIEEQRDLYVGR